MPANEGLDATPLSMLAVSPEVAVDGTLFVASADGTVLVSHDRGRTLDRIGFDVDASAITGLAISSRFRHDATVWAAVPDALLRSRDGGRTWEPMLVDPPDDLLDAVPDESAVRLLTVARDSKRDVLFLAIGPIIGRSDDGGERWHWLDPLGDAEEVVGLAGQPDQRGGCLYAATGRGGTPGQAGRQMIWWSGDGGQAWEPWLEVEGDGPPVLLSWDGPPSEPNLLVAAGSTVYVPRADARERRGRSTRPLWRFIEPGPGISRISSLATPTGPKAGRTIYAGTDQGVFVSRDGGLSFGPWGGDPGPTAFLAVAVAPDYASSREVFAVGQGGALWHRRDQ
jgi:hypothetical protein